jgi:putative oxidoreductase
MNRNIDLGILTLRLSVPFLMLLHGIAKFKGVESIQGMLESYGLPAILAYGVFITEIVAPLLMMIGFRTRLASLVFIFGVLAAIFLAHANDIFTLTKYGGWGIELLGLYLFGGIALYFTGGGKYAISQKSRWD